MRSQFKIVKDLVIKDLKGRYAGSIAGSLWLIIHPLMLIAIYSLVFSRLVAVRSGNLGGLYSYVIYLCSGLLPWICLESCLKSSALVFIDNANLIKKIPFPRQLLVIQVIVSQHIQFLLAMAIFLLLLLFLGYPLSWQLSLYPLVLLLQLLLLTGIALILAPLAVYLRDLAEWLTVFLTFLFWLTPIVYPEKTLPQFIRNLLIWNPADYLVRLQHQLFFKGEWPALSDLAIFATMAVLFFLLGVLLFKKLGRDLVDQI